MGTECSNQNKYHDGNGDWVKYADHDQAQRAVIEEARRTAEYWKAEHLAGNAKIEEQQQRIDELIAWRNDFHRAAVEWRGVEFENVCTECSGSGYTVYGNTTTYHRGAGGQAITTSVCDKCWGSGDRLKPWTSWLKIEQQAKEIEKLKSDVFLAQEAYEMTLQREKKQEAENQALRQALQAVLLDLQIILPMAKGYAHEHPVGNNKDKVYGVDAVIERAQQVLKEEK